MGFQNSVVSNKIRPLEKNNKIKIKKLLMYPEIQYVFLSVMYLIFFKVKMNCYRNDARKTNQYRRKQNKLF